MSILGGESNGEYTSLARVYSLACVCLYLCIRVPQQQIVFEDPITFATLLYLARTCVDTVGHRKVLQGRVEVRIGGPAPQKVNHSRRVKQISQITGFSLSRSFGVIGCAQRVNRGT